MHPIRLIVRAALVAALLLPLSPLFAGKIPIKKDEVTNAVTETVNFTGTTSIGGVSLGTVTAAGAAILDDADASAQRTTIGLGTIATQAASSVAITGGSIAGLTSAQMPNGTAPTVDAAGEIAIDTNGDGAAVTKGIITYFDGTTQLYAAGYDTAPATDGHVLTYDSGTNKLAWEATAGSTGVYREIWIPADTMTPDSVAPPAAGTATTSVNIDYLAFDDAADEIADYTLSMPDGWNLGTIKVRLYWYSVAATTGDCVWTVSSIARSAADAVAQAPAGTTSVTATTDGTAADLNITTTAAHTISGTPALHDLISLRITRDANAGGDTLVGDAILIGVKIQYLETTTEPAAW